MGKYNLNTYMSSDVKKTVTIDEYFERLNKFIDVYDDFIFDKVEPSKAKKVKKKLENTLLEFAEFVAENPDD